MLVDDRKAMLIRVLQLVLSNSNDEANIFAKNDLVQKCQVPLQTLLDKLESKSPKDSSAKEEKYVIKVSVQQE